LRFGFVWGILLTMAIPELDDLPALNRQLEETTPQAILRWAWETFAPNIAATSSFQTQSVPLLHMLWQTVPQMRVFFLDTGFHFSETLAFRDYLTSQWNLNLTILRPKLAPEAFLQEYGELFRDNPRLCCEINKVRPWREAILGLKAWITGIRRDQTVVRRKTPIIAREAGGVYKICPLAAWTGEAVDRYGRDHALPPHPLQAQGYRSLGCEPCTNPISEAEAERAGRWPGQGQTECGLHLPAPLDGRSQSS
jgi:phosphoadenosine phosphosulfate reductase